jgi:hypothetical protein
MEFARAAMPVVLAACMLVLDGLPAAARCPDNLVFSAYNGHGICAYPGLGAKTALTCFVAKGECPEGTLRNHKNSDPTRDYCCPSSTNVRLSCAWSGVGPNCEGTCGVGPGPRFIRNATSKGCVTGQKVECCRYLPR